MPPVTRGTRSNTPTKAKKKKEKTYDNDDRHVAIAGGTYDPYGGMTPEEVDALVLDPAEQPLFDEAVAIMTREMEDALPAFEENLRATLKKHFRGSPTPRKKPKKK